MDKKLIRMLSEHKEFSKGETYEIDSETAVKWIDADLAVAVNPSDVMESKIADLESAIKSSQLELIEKITKSVSVGVNAPAVHTNKEKKSFGGFLKAVAKQQSDKLEGEYNSKVLSGDEGSSGGYLIPEEFKTELLSVAGENSFARQRCFEIPMASDTLNINSLDQTGTSTGRSNFHGGVYVSWNENDTEPDNVEPTFKPLQLNAREQSAYTEIHKYMLDDGGNTAEVYLRELFGKAISWDIDHKILNGSGVGQPLGILNSGAKLGQARASNDVWTDVVNMLSKLTSDSMDKAVWVCNQTVMPSILKMTDGTNAIYHPNVQGKPTLMLFGIPVVFTEKVPVLASAGDIMLCDFSKYVLGVRSQMSIAVSEHVNFLKGRLTYVVRSRIDGQPMLSNPVTLADGTSQVSPFVSRLA